jgi:hypothetical protein
MNADIILIERALLSTLDCLACGTPCFHIVLLHFFLFFARNRLLILSHRCIETMADERTAPTTKRNLEVVVNKRVSLSPGAEERPTKKVKKAAAPRKPKLTEQEALVKSAQQVEKKRQTQINSKLQWKNSFKALKGGTALRGARVEVTCNDPKVFEKISQNASIKKTKDRLSCSFKTDDEVDTLPLHGKSYRYNASEVRAPVSASLKDNTLTFTFQICHLLVSVAALSLTLVVVNISSNVYFYRL